MTVEISGGGQQAKALSLPPSLSLSLSLSKSGRGGSIASPVPSFPSSHLAFIWPFTRGRPQGRRGEEREISSSSSSSSTPPVAEFICHGISDNDDRPRPTGGPRLAPRAGERSLRSSARGTAPLRTTTRRACAEDSNNRSFLEVKQSEMTEML